MNHNWESTEDGWVCGPPPPHMVPALTWQPTNPKGVQRPIPASRVPWIDRCEGCGVRVRAEADMPDRFNLNDLVEAAS